MRNKNNTGVGVAIGAAVVGAAVGAAAVALSDEKNRKQVVKKVNAATSKAGKQLGGLKEKAQTVISEGTKKLPVKKAAPAKRSAEKRTAAKKGGK